MEAQAVEDLEVRNITNIIIYMPENNKTFLRELLYLWNGEKMLLKVAAIHSISEKKLSATITYDLFDPDIHEIKNEIKAVTYHKIKVEQKSEYWISNIIFDV